MMVQAAADMGDTPVKTHQTPIVDLSSTSKPQKKQKPKRKQRKEAEVSHDKSGDEDHVSTPSSDPLHSHEDSFTLNELIVFCTDLKEQELDLQEAKATQAKKIAALKKKVTKLNKWRKSRSGGLRRLKKIGSGRRVKSFMKKDGFGAQEDASKQGRMIEEIDQHAEIALDDDTQGRTNDDEMYRVDDCVREEVVMDTTTGEHEEHIIEDVSTAELVTIAGEVVTTTAVNVSAAPTTDVTKDEITMAQALAALKSTKPKVMVQEQQMSTIIPSAVTTVITVDKGKAKMIEPEVPIKKKDQMMIDEELQAREKEEFSEVKKARLLVELIEKRKKHFAALRAQEKRNKPPTKTQMKSQMSTYLKHMGRYKQSHLKGRSFDEIKEPFDREIRKQKVDENVEPIIDDTEELKKCMEIVLDDGDEVLIEATSLSFRSPTIIDYKIHNEGKKTYFKIIRADDNSQIQEEKPVDDMDNLLFRTLKTMFEHHVEDTIWKYQQGLARIYKIIGFGMDAGAFDVVVSSLVMRQKAAERKTAKAQVLSEEDGEDEVTNFEVVMLHSGVVISFGMPFVSCAS
nr:hypothetical protein [Tanacetum cinerariifolium]